MSKFSALHQTFSPVLVVGAGPAGATAARTLAMAGVPVRLLDRSLFPRNKPCGGAISIRALSRFPYLNHELRKIPTHQVSRLYLEGPRGEATVIESERPAVLMIRRVEFDDLLVSSAVAAGAELVTGAEIVQARATGDQVLLTARDGRRFEASLVIAADGVHSVIARRLGLNTGWPATAIALDMMEETPRTTLRDLDPSTLWVAYGFNLPSRGVPPDHPLATHRSGETPTKPMPTGDGNSRLAPEGYAYVFPKRDHVNVGIGYVLSYYRDSLDDAPYDLQLGFVDALRRRGIIAGESVRQNFTPFLIPLGGPLREPGRGRVLLAGDAGGFVNGFTAEGIYYAMVSGDLAARAIVESPRAVLPTLAHRYRRACNWEIGTELRDSVLIQRYLFADRRRIAHVIESASRQRAMTRLILDLVIGKRGYRDVRRRVFARSPLLAGRLVWERIKTQASPVSNPNHERSPAMRHRDADNGM